VNITRDLTALENLSARDGFFRRLHPAVKIGATFVFVATVISFDRHVLGQMTPYILYPVITGVLVSIPFSLSLRRLVPALPFCLFAGLSNLVFERETALILGGFSVSFGFLSFFSLLFRTLLCVEAVILLAATTPVYAIMAQLRRFGMPSFLVTLLEMTYRYIGVPAAEARSLRLAYQLRGGSRRGVDLTHMGSFIGSLFLRSMIRTENISNAMRLRGYGDTVRYAQKEKIKIRDVLFFALFSIFCALFRLVDIPLVIGKLWYGLFM
jgi:cobalt/nickel transport system permease protein